MSSIRRPKTIRQKKGDARTAIHKANLQVLNAARELRRVNRKERLRLGDSWRATRLSREEAEVYRDFLDNIAEYVSVYKKEKDKGTPIKEKR